VGKRMSQWVFVAIFLSV
jgi:hypothetical protein